MAPPGSNGLPAEVASALAAAWSKRAADYVPRTRHLRSAAEPKYTNRLFLETSPYLRQHAHNPVNWYPWGDEAFAVAERLGRPILLSVGYSTCHWCHVMEEESFEDEETARYINENYIAVKVDREERPDIDSIYMAAVQELAGRGGWPMTVWLTPGRKPFYGGTYFPKPKFRAALEEATTVYRDKPELVAETGEALARAIHEKLTPAGAAGDGPEPANLEKAVELFHAGFDPVHGGARGKPKFPSHIPSRLLLRHYRRTGDRRSLQAAVFTLEKMAAGGIFDHIGGGFHRYAVDDRWQVPHFEKMLYDNALLVMAFVEAYAVVGIGELASIAHQTLRWAAREMTSPRGAFYSATDADSLTPKGEREEGRYFTWTVPEVMAVVGADDARVVNAYFGVTEAGDLDGRNVLNKQGSVAEVAEALSMSPEGVTATVERSVKALYQARKRRSPPLRDDKILAAWNGLMISAFAQAALVFDQREYLERAAKAATFVLDHMRDEKGRLYRSFKDGRAHHMAYLDDYAFMVAALLDLFEASHEVKWLASAIALDQIVAKHYSDEAGGAYFATSNEHEALLAREKPRFDGSVPSGNSIHAMNLLRLYELTTEESYLERVEALFAELDELLERDPSEASELLMAVDFYLDRPKQIVIVTPSSRDQAAPLLSQLRKMHVPNRVLVVASEGADLQEQSHLVPLLAGKVARRGKVTAYVCEQRVCQLPTSEPEVFAKQLATVYPLDRYR